MSAGASSRSTLVDHVANSIGMMGPLAFTAVPSTRSRPELLGDRGGQHVAVSTGTSLRRRTSSTAMATKSGGSHESARRTASIKLLGSRAAAPAARVSEHLFHPPAFSAGSRSVACGGQGTT